MTLERQFIILYLKSLNRADSYLARQDAETLPAPEVAWVAKCPLSASIICHPLQAEFGRQVTEVPDRDMVPWVPAGRQTDLVPGYG